ncbi:MAG: hypothetical protein WBN96_03490 [Gammaproteobacteria bacterium]
MPSDQRIVLFMVVLLMLLTGFVVLQNPQVALGVNGKHVLTVLVLLSFTMIMVQHYFIRPTDIIISATSILLLLSPVYPLVQASFIWYPAFVAYSALVLLLALVSLFSLGQEKPLSADKNHVVLSLHSLPLWLGHKTVLWLTMLVLCGVLYYQARSNMFLVLAGYALLVLLVNPEKILATLAAKDRSLADTALADTSVADTSVADTSAAPVIAAEADVHPVVETVPDVHVPRGIAQIITSPSNGTLLARMHSDQTLPSRFDVLGMQIDNDGESEWKTGLVLDHYVENGEHWLRIITDDSFAELKLKTRRFSPAVPGDVYVLTPRHSIYLFEHLAGTIGDRRTVDKIQFVAAPGLSVTQGELLNIKRADGDVFYQVLYAPVMHDNGQVPVPASGLALQLGCWNEDTMQFEKKDWVPELYCPIYKAEEIVAAEPELPEYQLGTIPATNYPVVINCETALAHNLAVLGAAGTEKSAFTRKLISRAANEKTKFICFGCGPEDSVVPDPEIASLVSAAFQKKLTEAAEVMCDELDRDPLKQDRDVILLQETILRGGFMAAVTEFLKNDAGIARLELPPFPEAAAGLQYASWFLNALYELARSKKFGSVRLCVVLDGISASFAQLASSAGTALDVSTLVDSIQLIAQQDSDYGLGLIVVDEQLTELSGPVIRQCQSVIAFRQDRIHDNEYFISLMGDGFMSVLTRLEPRRAIAAGKAFNCQKAVMLEIA